MAQIFTKDKDDRLDYAFKWSDWLATDETILSYIITVPDGIILETESPFASSESDGIVTYWLSGGTPFKDYDIACKITTSTGRIKEHTMLIKVREQ